MAQARRWTQAPREAADSIEDVRRHYDEFTRLLLERRTELERRKIEARQNLGEQLNAGPGDEADASVADTSADYFLKLANDHERELHEIRDALERMQRGEYGACENCENPVAVERLKRLPYARLCIECQAAFERGRGQIFPREHPKL